MKQGHTPNIAKSIAMTTKVTTHARNAKILAKTAPMTPAPRARRNAMKARPQAMGWRIMTFVRALALSEAAVLKEVPSALDMTLAGE